jgi:hypothetical protein
MAMTKIFMGSRMPRNSMSTGTRTGGGIARKNSRVGSRKARRRREEPMSMPSTMPNTSARP